MKFRFVPILVVMLSSALRSPAADDALELAVLAGDAPQKLAIRVEIDGQQLAKIQTESFAKLFAFFDRNGDGVLDEAEAAAMPSPISLRQVLWGQLMQPPGVGGGADWTALDADSNDKVNVAEVAGFYRRNGIAMPFVGVGKPAGTAKMTESLLAALDANKDKRVDETEWKAAADALRKFDKNDDELIGPGELVAGLSYPGAAATRWLAPAARDAKADPVIDELPIVIGSAHEARLPAATWLVHLGKANSVGSFEKSASKTAVLSRGAVRFELRADAGRADEQLAKAKKNLTDFFQSCDTDGDGALDGNEFDSQKAVQFRVLMPVIDRDADRKLTDAEIKAWLELHDQMVKGQVLISVLDHGCGLFEFLDADRDGALSVRELRTAAARMKSTGFDPAKLPRQLSATVSRGHPKNPIVKPVRPGPDWFVAMDRNGDGDVSRREFTGPADAFAKLDVDEDGLLSAEEAAKAAKPK